MKKLSSLVLLSIGFLSASAQADTTIYGYIDANTYREAEIIPVFAGGAAAWKRYLDKNLYHGAEIPKASKSNTVTVQFVMEVDNKITEIKIVKSLDTRKDKKALDIITNGYWMPAVQNGKQVRYRKRIDIVFPEDTSL